MDDLLSLLPCYFSDYYRSDEAALKQDHFALMWFPTLGIEPRASYMLGKCLTTELKAQDSCLMRLLSLGAAKV